MKREKEWTLNRVRKITDNRVGGTSRQSWKDVKAEGRMSQAPRPLIATGKWKNCRFPGARECTGNRFRCESFLYPSWTSVSKTDECKALAVFRIHPDVDRVSLVTYQQVLTRLFNSRWGTRGFAEHYSILSRKDHKVWSKSMIIRILLISDLE